MKNLSIKLQDSTYLETERLVAQLKMNRNSYLNAAISFYNRYQNAGCSRLNYVLNRHP